jgi:hypothetical protein
MLSLYPGGRSLRTGWSAATAFGLNLGTPRFAGRACFESAFCANRRWLGIFLLGNAGIERRKLARR